MASQVVVEVLDSRRRVQARTRIAEFPAGIGRGLANAVIVDDPYVDAHHLQLTQMENGALKVADLGSVNGTFGSSNGTRVAEVTVQPGLELRIGRTRVRFQDPEQAVAPAVKDRQDGRWLALLGSPRVVISVALFTLIAFLISTWLDTYARTTIEKMAVTTVFAYLVLVLWAGLWSVASRVIQHRFNFLAHLTLASVISVAISICSAIATWLGVLAPNAGVDAVVGLVTILPLVFVLISGHLALTSLLGVRARRLTTAGILIAVAALGTLSWWSDRDDFDSDLEYTSDIRPVPLSLLTTGSVDELFTETRELRERVDTLAVKANRKSPSR